MTEPVHKIVERIMETIESETEPSVMDKQMAYDVYDKLRDELAVRMECLDEEMKNDGNEDG